MSSCVMEALPQYGIMLGDGYGDALAVLGNIQHLLAETGQAEIGVIHYGKNKGVDAFLCDQPCIREVVRVEPKSREEFMEFCNAAGAYYTDVPERWLPKLLKGTPIDWTMVAMTQIHWPWGAWQVHRPKNVVIPDACYEWAHGKRKEIGPFVLVQPFSLNSVMLADHWPHWHKAIRWLIDSVNIPLAFCGVDPISGLAGENVVNLIGQTPSMQHVFALSEVADATVTTCNALGLWTAYKGVRALVAANLAIADRHFYFYRWQDHAQNRMVPFQATFEQWRKEAKAFMAEAGVAVKEVAA